MEGAEDLDSGWIQALDYIPEKNRIVFSAQPTTDHVIRIAELGAIAWSAPFNDQYLDGTCIAVEPEGKWFAVGNIDKISIYGLQDSDSPDPICEIDCDASVISIAISERGEIVAGDDDGSISVWDLESRSVIMELKGHEGITCTVNALALKRRRLLSAGSDSTVRVWDLSSAKCLAVLHHRQGSIASGVSMRYSGKRIVSAGTDGLFVWDLDAHDIR
jgi:WD40 repeat protein